MAVQDALGGPDRAQLISADSALIYRGMDIGTAKPSIEELQAYPHQLVDILDPSETYSAADFVADADAAILQAVAEGKKPIVVGGTMMYLKCLMQGIARLPSTDERCEPIWNVSLKKKAPLRYTPNYCSGTRNPPPRFTLIITSGCCVP